MNCDDFYWKIMNLRKSREDLFTSKIRNSDLYRQLSLYPSLASDANECNLLIAIKAFDDITLIPREQLLHYSERDQNILLNKATATFDDIRKYASQINW